MTSRASGFAECKLPPEDIRDVAKLAKRQWQFGPLLA